MGRLCEALLADQFDGATYVPVRDQARLSGQLDSVRKVLADKQWHTLNEIASKVRGSEAGVSARIRDLRKPKFGSHVIDRQHVSGGVWRYRMAT